jgi:hypothetical protein
MVVKKDKTERAIELVELAETKRKKPDHRQWGYKIREMSIDVRKIRDKEKRARLIRNFLSKRPGIKELVFLAQDFAFPQGEHGFDDIVLIETFINYQYHAWEVLSRVKWSGVHYFELYSTDFYSKDHNEARNKAIKFLKENLP